LFILEQRGIIIVYDRNVVIKTTGGIQLTEQASILAVLMSIASSLYNVGIASDIVFIADVGLTGELKRVPSLEARLREVDRMGFRKAFIPPNSLRKNLDVDLQIEECKTLKDVINRCFYK